MVRKGEVTGVALKVIKKERPKVIQKETPKVEEEKEKVSKGTAGNVGSTVTANRTALKAEPLDYSETRHSCSNPVAEVTYGDFVAPLRTKIGNS